MKKIFTDTKLRDSMLQFMHAFKEIDTYSDSGYLKTPIGDKTDYEDYIYVGVYDEYASTMFSHLSTGTMSSRKYSEVAPHIFSDTITDLVNSKSCKWKEEDKELFSKIDTCKFLMLPFNFKMHGRDNVVRNREIQVGADAGMIIKIEARYNPITKMCPLQYTCQSKTGTMRFNLIDYPNKHSLVSFSDGNYVKTIVMSDKKAKQQLVIDCTGIYLLKKGSEEQITDITNRQIDTTDWESFGISDKLIQEVERNKQLIFIFWRWIVPYKCGEIKEMTV